MATVSVWEEEKVLETGGSDGHTTVRVGTYCHWTGHLKTGYSGKCVVRCIWHNFIKRDVVHPRGRKAGGDARSRQNSPQGFEWCPRGSACLSGPQEMATMWTWCHQQLRTWHLPVRWPCKRPVLSCDRVRTTFRPGHAARGVAVTTQGHGAGTAQDGLVGVRGSCLQTGRGLTPLRVSCMLGKQLGSR